MNLPSYISMQAVVMLFLFGTSVSYLLGRRKTNRPFLMALIGGVLAVMPPIICDLSGAVAVEKDVTVPASTAKTDLDEPKPRAPYSLKANSRAD